MEAPTSLPAMTDATDTISCLIYGLVGVIATAWPAALHVYFDLFSGAIQTYVFCMLTMTYIANARGDA